MIFVDASAWIALVHARDANHEAAMRFQRELAKGRHGRIVTSDYVLDEAATYLAQRGGAGALSAFRGSVQASESVQITWTTPERFWEARQRLEERGDQRWSLTDCLSFVTREALGITAAFAFDSDFEQAGFQRYPLGRA